MTMRILAATAAVSILAACGGGSGGGGGAGEERGPIVPSVAAYEHDNPTAQDLLDHWNDPQRLSTALSLSPVSNPGESRAAIASLLNINQRDPSGTGTHLRNVRAEDVTIIGEREGITYGQWKGGPAGTLNIEFDWRFAQNVNAEARARMERAGKLWSYRITDDFGTHTAPGGTSIVHGDVRETIAVETTTNGVIIFVLDKGRVADNSSSATFHEAHIEPDDVEPWLGTILLNPKHHDYTSVMAHEIGHVLGIGTTTNFPSGARYVNRQDHTFEGPNAMRANGGNPVPYQWTNADNEPVPPGTPGATVDYGHLGVCTSLMAYCRDRREVAAPSELDFAFLDDIGYEILDRATASEPELYGYGAWARYSAWGAGVERILNNGDKLRAGADAFGIAPGAPLAASTLLRGEATWTGSLLGVDTGHEALPPVFGDATLKIALADLSGNLRFHNLVVDLNGVSRSFRQPGLQYGVTVAGNGFSDDRGAVRGGFFGPDHEEMAGVLDDREVQLLAGFGGKR